MFRTRLRPGTTDTVQIMSERELKVRALRAKQEDAALHVELIKGCRQLEMPQALVDKMMKAWTEYRKIPKDPEDFQIEVDEFETVTGDYVVLQLQYRKGVLAPGFMLLDEDDFITHEIFAAPDMKVPDIPLKRLWEKPPEPVQQIVAEASRRPNAKCPTCGRKNKKCRCP